MGKVCVSFFFLDSDRFRQIVVKNPFAETRLLLENALEGVDETGDVAVPFKLFVHEFGRQIISQLRHDVDPIANQPREPKVE